MAIEPTTCPDCGHAWHLIGTECEDSIQHGATFWHRCLCLARPGAALTCPPQLTCQGGTLGWGDLWYLQQGISLRPDNGALPRRGDAVEQWLKKQRDAASDYPTAYQAADGLLDLYRLHADTGKPLREHACEGWATGDCDCFEVSQTVEEPEPKVVRAEEIPISDAIVGYLSKRAGQRIDAVIEILASFTDRERALFREAAVMGYAQGTRHMRGEKHPKDSDVLFRVVDACRAFEDKYPATTGYVPEVEKTEEAE